MSFRRLLTCTSVSMLFLGSSYLYAQPDSMDQLPLVLEDQIESFLQNLDDEVDFDFNTIGEYLLALHEHPLNLNEADVQDLEGLRILSNIQISELISYRNRLGPLHSIYELQSIPSFDRKTIVQLRPFVTINNARNPIQGNKILKEGSDEIFIRWTRNLQRQRAYSLDPPAFEGDQNGIYLRYRHRFQNKLSYGVTLDKDAGEALFGGSNPQGFDFASAHFFIHDFNENLKAVALGDFAVSLGQGLLLHSGFGRSKSAFVTQIKRGGSIIRPYTSVNESSFLRGAATTFQLGSWQITAFGSYNRVDGNVRIDSADSNETFSQFTSLQLSGLHRTRSEIEDENAVGHRVLGAQIAYQKNNRLKVGLNLLDNRFDRPFLRRQRLYNQHYFSGTRLSNASFEFTYLLNNFHFFGETAISDNGALASTHGILVGLSQFLDLAILYRNISSKYQSIQANPFLESSQALNERGVYLGLDFKFNQSFSLSLYADHWKHPWLRFNVDAPSHGREYLARFTFYQKRKIDAYVQYRYEQKAFNDRSLNSPLSEIFYGSRQNLRIHFNNKLNANLELRNRIEFTWVEAVNSPLSNGLLIYQDVIYRSLNSPFSFTARLAYFDADSYAARVYAYENDILYSFSIPAYYNEGIRYYTNLRYRLNKTITMEARWEQTVFKDVEEIGSGNALIQGNRRSRIKVQCRIKF